MFCLLFRLFFLVFSQLAQRIPPHRKKRELSHTSDSPSDLTTFLYFTIFYFQIAPYTLKILSICASVIFSSALSIAAYVFGLDAFSADGFSV